MAKRRTPRSDRSRKIERLLTAVERLLGVSVCLHDRFQRAMLPGHWQFHHGDCCAPFRSEQFAVCKGFDGDQVHRHLADHPEGRVHVCPFGVCEVAMPVMAGDWFAGVLFAGPFALSGFTGKNSGKDIGKDALARAEDARVLLRCVANEMGNILFEEEPQAPPAGKERRREIMAWLEESMEQAPRLPDLARRLNLSASRAARVVVETFRVSFTELVQSTKLNTAAYWLSTGGLPVGEIAVRLGYCDQAHFTRLFTRRFGQSPARYRRAAVQAGLGA